MFPIINELADNSPARTASLIGTSVGSSGFIYLLVAITGYFSFGDNVSGNIIGMCTLNKVISSPLILVLIPLRSTFNSLDNMPSRNRPVLHALLSASSSSMSSLNRRRVEMATKASQKSSGLIQSITLTWSSIYPDERKRSFYS